MNQGGHRRRSRRGKWRGSAITEFTLIAPVFLTLAFGLAEFSNVLQHRVLVANSARDGVRYATFHARSFSNLASPPSNTIEGEILSEGSNVQVANNDTNISIEYYSTNGSPNFNTTTKCGHFSQSTNAWVVDAAGVTQAQCTAVGHLVKVTVSHTYILSTPIQVLFPSGVTATSSAWGTIQQ